MCKRQFKAMTEAADSSSSPATLALANADCTLKRSLPIKTRFGAPSSSLQSMLATARMEMAVVESEEDNVAFPSIEWDLEDDSTADNCSGDALDALAHALAILKENEDYQFRLTAKRRRMGEPCMVRSKAVKTHLSSLAISCAKESNMMSLPKFILGNWETMVSAHDVTTDMASCSLKSTSSFVDTNTVKSSLLTV